MKKYLAYENFSHCLHSFAQFILKYNLKSRVLRLLDVPTVLTKVWLNADGFLDDFEL